jgi:hypothetical protein
MGEGSEAPQTRLREESQKPTNQPGEPQLQKQRETREKRSPVEVVPECPQIRRQMLFTRPFTVYDDVIDAAQQNSGKLEKEVPAIHFLLDTSDDGARLCVGDEDGKKLGWINRDDNNGYEWNIRSVWQPGPNALLAGFIPIYSRPNRAAGPLEMAVSDTTLLPILKEQRDNEGDIWYQVGPSLIGDGVATRIKNPPLDSRAK